MMDNDLNSEEQERQVQHVRKAYREAVLGAAREAARETREQAHGVAHDAVDDEPPASIDDAIRAAARRAVAAKPQPLQKKWHQRWATPLTAAATVLLTSSIIFVAMEEHPAVITEPLGDAARVEISSPPTPLTPPMVASLPAPIPTPAPMPEQAAPASAAAAAAQKPAMPLANDVDSRRQKSDTVAASQTTIAQPKANNAPRADIADSALEKKAVADASEPPAKAAGQTHQPRAVSAPIITNLMPMPPNKPVKEAPAYVASAVASAAAPAAAPIPASAAGKLEKSETAEAWIARMTDLKAQHKNSEPNNQLHDELIRFRKRYPNTTLPESLAEEWAKIERTRILPP